MHSTFNETGEDRYVLIMRHWHWSEWMDGWTDGWSGSWMDGLQ